MTKRFVLTVLVFVTASLAPAGADWPQWRGPNRDCVAPDGGALSDAWPQKGPPLVWTSERIPGGNAGGYGSVVVAQGRVYLLCTPKWNEPITERPLNRGWGNRLGYVPPARRPPAELDKKVEAARCSQERAKLQRKQLGPWIKKFIADNLTTEEDKKKLTSVINSRLAQGDKALTWEDLDKVAALKGKGFADQAGLDKWLDECGFKGEVRKRIAGQFPTTKQMSNDVLWCLDAKDGKKVWSKTYPGVPLTYGNSNTPAVFDGKVFAIGSNSVAYCFDAATGAEVWTYKGSRGQRSSSFLLLDGKAIALLGPLTALDAAKGTVLWKQQKIGGVHQSPIAWTHEGKTYVIANTDRSVYCVDPKDGAILWRVRGGGWGTPAVAGNRLVVYSGPAKQLLCYTISPEKAEKAWGVKVGGDRGASPTIWKGHVYVYQAGRALCVELNEGKICWDQKLGTCECGSAVLANGKLLGVGGGGKGLFLTKAVPDKYTPLTKTRLQVTDCTTPAVVNGRMYVRRPNAVGCYDLTAKPPAAAPANP